MQQRSNSSFERLITSISTNFINLDSHEIDRGIEHTLKLIGEYAGVDRCYVFKFSSDMSNLTNTHEWCAPGVASQKERLAWFPVSNIPYQMTRLKRFETVYIPCVGEMPSHVEREKELFKSLNILSLILVPMKLKNNLIGFIGFDAIRYPRQWSEHVISLLSIVGEIFVNALERKRIEEELERSHEHLEQRVKERTMELARVNIRLQKETQEHQRTGQALKERNDYIQDLMDSAKSVALYRLRRGRSHGAARDDAEVVFVSPSIIDIVGHTDPLNFKTWFENIHEDDVERVLQANKASLEDGKVFNEVFRINNRVRGERRWLDVLSVPTVDHDGDAVYFNGFISDVTEKMRVEEFLRSLIDANPESLMLISPGGTVLDANLTASRWLDRPMNALVGSCLYDLVDPDRAQRLRDQVNEVIITRGSVQIIEEVHGKHLETHLCPIFDLEGRLAQLAIFSLDRTRQRQAIAAMKATEQELRTLSLRLMNAEENERKRISQELHDSIGQYLSAIKYRTENIINDLEQGKPVDTCESLKETIPIIQDTIDEVYKICMSLRPTVLDDLGIIETLTWYCGEHNKIYRHIRVHQDFRLSEDDIEPKLKINIFRIVQEALNNAVKHSRATRVDVGLRKKAGMLELTVRDNGVGLDAETMDPSASLHKGFGIPSMKERTKLNGGNFSLTSEKGTYTMITAGWPCR